MKRKREGGQDGGGAGRRRALAPALLVALALCLPGRREVSGAEGAVAALPGWRYTCADCPQNWLRIGDQNLRLDSQGRPHVAYGGDAITYARFDGAAWQVEVVADELSWAAGWYHAPPALALDSEDGPHIVYLDETGWLLMYAWKVEGAWQREVIEPSTPRGFLNRTDTALSLDAGGNPHVAYNNDGDLRYAARWGGTWTIETVDSERWTSIHVSLALDAGGAPHIAYHSFGDP